MLQLGDTIYDDEELEYKIKKSIGHGGMGHVLLVNRLSDNKEFAVKTLPVFLEGDLDHKALINEGRLAESIKHKNVICYEYFHAGEKYEKLPPYIIMELAETQNLQDLINSRIKSGELFKQDELLDILSMLIDGMEAINTVLVHRDIKPANILLKNGEVKISDFGIAKIAGDSTRSKSFKGSGTIAFASPEAFSSGENTIKMDIYSMGIVFYLLATLQHPYEIDEEIKNDDEWKDAHLFKSAQFSEELNENLSSKIFAVIQKMMEKNPKKRFSSWDELRKELETIDKLKKSNHSVRIEKMIKKNSERKTQKAEEELKKAQEKEKVEQVEKMILYQFENDIILPIKDFIEEYNQINVSTEDQLNIRETHEMGRMMFRPNVIYKIERPGVNGDLEVSLKIIKDEDYSVIHKKDVFDRPHTETIKPMLNGKDVLAWGQMKDRDGKGFNIVLHKSDESDYGDWVILENIHSPLYQKKDSRPEPFPFDYEELRKEIYNIGTIHIYEIQESRLQSEKITEFISDL